MDSFEWNKIAGAVLAGAIGVLGLSLYTSSIYKSEPLKQQSYVIDGVEAEGGEAGPAKEAEKPIAFYLASASPEKGAAVFKKCAACHTVTSGGATGIGPNLYGIVGNVHAHAPGFGYSDGMMAAKGKPWDWDTLNAWLTSPKAVVAGTKMAFAGLSKPQDRADIIAYLNTQSAKPLPMPAVPAEAPAAAPAADAAAAPAADAAKTDAAAAPAAK